jgi:hypothetical protein
MRSDWKRVWDKTTPGPGISLPGPRHAQRLETRLGQDNTWAWDKFTWAWDKYTWAWDVKAKA